MRIQSTLLVIASLLIPTATWGGSTLGITPTESLSTVRDKLRADANITEVILAEGVYFGGLSVEDEISERATAGEPAVDVLTGCR